MSLPDSESARRKRVAKGFLALIFVALRIADALLLFYVALPGNESALFTGAVAGSILYTTTLIVGIWRRQSWARYVLITLNWAFTAVISYPVFVAWGRRELSMTLPNQLLVAAVVLYAASTALLICSRRIRHLATMSMIGR